MSDHRRGSWFLHLVAWLKRAWRLHCHLLADNPLYRTVLVILTDLVLGQLDVPDLIQTLVQLIGST